MAQNRHRSSDGDALPGKHLVTGSCPPSTTRSFLLCSATRVDALHYRMRRLGMMQSPREQTLRPRSPFLCRPPRTCTTPPRCRCATIGRSLVVGMGRLDKLAVEDVEGIAETCSPPHHLPLPGPRGNAEAMPH